MTVKEKGTALELFGPLGHDFDPDTPEDVDWLYQWATIAQEKIRALEAERDALKVDKAGAMSALGMARSEITTLKARIAELLKVVESAGDYIPVDAPWWDEAIPFLDAKKEAPS
jgi:hypothetical protein